MSTHTFRKTLPVADRSVALGEAINRATRAAHANLNKQIIARLPLALPPRAADPSLYTTGLLHITAVYQAFESAWLDLLQVDPQPSTPQPEYPSDPDEGRPHTPFLRDPSRLSSSGPGSCSCQGEPSHTSARHPPEPLHLGQRLHAALGSIYLHEMPRTARLKNDIHVLTGWTVAQIDKEIERVCEGSRLGDFVAHIERSIRRKPHVLFAYTHILFMALFAGGRFIRATLEAAEESFWETVPSPIRPSMTPCEQSRQPLNHLHPFLPVTSPPPGSTTAIHQNSRGEWSTSAKCQGTGMDDERDFAHSAMERLYGHPMPLDFFHFDTPFNGEDLKREFKTRLREAEAVLSDQERREVVTEAVCVFDNMLLLVSQLDSVCATSGQDEGYAENNAVKAQENEHEEARGIDDDGEDKGELTTEISGQHPAVHPDLYTQLRTGRVQDSVAVAKERSRYAEERARRRSSSSSSDGKPHRPHLRHWHHLRHIRGHHRHRKDEGQKAADSADGSELLVDADLPEKIRHLQEPPEVDDQPVRQVSESTVWSSLQRSQVEGIPASPEGAPDLAPIAGIYESENRATLFAEKPLDPDQRRDVPPAANLSPASSPSERNANVSVRFSDELAMPERSTEPPTALTTQEKDSVPGWSPRLSSEPAVRQNNSSHLTEVERAGFPMIPEQVRIAATPVLGVFFVLVGLYLLHRVVERVMAWL